MFMCVPRALGKSKVQSLGIQGFFGVASKLHFLSPLFFRNFRLNVEVSKVPGQWSSRLRKLRWVQGYSRNSRMPHKERFNLQCC